MPRQGVGAQGPEGGEWHDLRCQLQGRRRTSAARGDARGVCVCVEGVASTWQTPRRVYCRLASALAHICGNTHVTSVPGSVCPRRHPQDMYILNAAEKAGIDLPATCRGGICGRVSSCLCSVFQRSLSARLCCSPWLLQGVCWSGDVRQSGPERRAWQDLSVCHWRAH